MTCSSSRPARWSCCAARSTSPATDDVRRGDREHADAEQRPRRPAAPTRVVAARRAVGHQAAAAAARARGPGAQLRAAARGPRAAAVRRALRARGGARRGTCRTGAPTRPGARMTAPARGGHRPTSTYRVQLRPGFGFDDVAALSDYLAALGVTHVYLSPVLEATPGSTHGYDVVDHDLLSTEAGGRAAFDRMTSALAARGLSAVADVVPNHMAVPTPVRLNHALWSVLRDGPASPFADWFDVDWSVPDRAVLMPVLGDRIGTALVRGEITVDRTGARAGAEVLRQGVPDPARHRPDCRWRSSSTGSGTGWRGGGSPTRS